MSNEFYQAAAEKFIFNVKKDFLYTENDVWVKVEDERIRIGVTDFFQRRGGDIVYVELPKVGNNVKRLEEISQVETIKAILPVTSPFSGLIIEVNTVLSDKPELINEEPYGGGWMLLISPSNLKEDLGKLLTAERYFDLMKSKIEDELKKSKKEV